MSTTVAAAQSAILTRVRDVAATAHGDVLLDVMSDCQRVINACYGGVFATASMTLTTRKVGYIRTDIAANVVRPIQVAVDGRILTRVPWTEFKSADPFWVHAVGKPQAWDFVGHNLLFVYPSPRDGEVVTADVTYITETADCTAGGTLEIPDAHVPAFLDLVCEVLLLRQRLFPSIQEAAESFTHHSNPRIVP